MAKHCFVIMSFDKALDPVYTTAIREAARNKGYTCTRADEIRGSDDISDTVIKAIIAADLIITDLSDPRPNVCFELAIAFSVATPTICISQTPDLPLDFRNYRVIIYHSNELPSLRLEIEDAINHLSQYSSNPVVRAGRDYFDQRGKIEENLHAIAAELARIKEYLEFRVKKWADNTPVADKLLEHIWQRYSLRRKEKRVIAISGAGSIGKSTFSRLVRRRLAKRLPEDRTIEILGTDAYMMSRADRAAQNITGFDIRAYDLEKLERSVEKLMDGEDVTVTPYDHGTGFHKEPRVIRSPDILILEGIHALHPPISHFINYSTFLYTNKPYVKELKFLADATSRGYTPSESFRHSEREYLDYEEHVLPYFRQANEVIFVEGYWCYRLEGVKGFYREERPDDVEAE